MAVKPTRAVEATGAAVTAAGMDRKSDGRTSVEKVEVTVARAVATGRKSDGCTLEARVGAGAAVVNEAVKVAG